MDSYIDHEKNCKESSSNLEVKEDLPEEVVDDFTVDLSQLDQTTSSSQSSTGYTKKVELLFQQVSTSMEEQMKSFQTQMQKLKDEDIEQSRKKKHVTFKVDTKTHDGKLTADHDLEVSSVPTSKKNENASTLEEESAKEVQEPAGYGQPKEETEDLKEETNAKTQVYEEEYIEFDCELCDKSFPTQSAKEDHRIIAHGQPKGEGDDDMVLKEDNSPKVDQTQGQPDLFDDTTKMTVEDDNAYFNTLGDYFPEPEDNFEPIPEETFEAKPEDLTPSKKVVPEMLSESSAPYDFIGAPSSLEHLQEINKNPKKFLFESQRSNHLKTMLNELHDIVNKNKTKTAFREQYTVSDEVWASLVQKADEYSLNGIDPKLLHAFKTKYGPFKSSQKDKQSEDLYRKYYPSGNCKVMATTGNTSFMVSIK